MYILLSAGTLCIHYPHLSTSTDGALNINCVDKPTQPRFKLLHSALVLPNFYSCIRWSIEHQDRCSMTVVEYMFSTRQRCCKPDKSPTQGLPAPSHFALQRWHVCLLFFPFSFLLASLYTLNCTESFDGGWEESECCVEEKRNWALTLIRWRASEKKRLLLNTTGSIVKVNCW